TRLGEVLTALLRISRAQASKNDSTITPLGGGGDKQEDTRDPHGARKASLRRQWTPPRDCTRVRGVVERSEALLHVSCDGDGRSAGFWA
ncbi:unnamed protein product, partial [Ectocarpus sp. 12 AP-2014]